MAKPKEAMLLLIGAKDVSGLLELTVEVTCKRCKARTTLTFRPQEVLDYCGFCDQPHEFHLDYGRLFGSPEVL